MYMVNTVAVEAAVEVEPKQTASPEPPTLLQELLNIVTFFHDPARAFRSLAGAARPFLPLLLMTALSVGLTAMHRARVPHDVRLAAQIEQAQSLGVAASTHEASLGSELGSVAVFSFLATLAMSLVLWFAFRVTGERLKYRPVLSIFSYAMLPAGLVWTLMAAATLLLSDPNTVEPLRSDKLVASSLGALLSSLSLSPFVESVLTSIDVFSIWIVVLTVVGMAVYSGVNRRKAAWTVSLLWCLSVLGKGAGAVVVASLAK
jgi:hypothetical protein